MKTTNTTETKSAAAAVIRWTLAVTAGVGWTVWALAQIAAFASK